MTYFEQRFGGCAGSKQFQDTTKASKQGSYFPLNAAQVHVASVLSS